MDIASSVFYDLSFAAKKQDYSSSHLADIERFVVLIEYQDWRIYHNFIPCQSKLF